MRSVKPAATRMLGGIKSVAKGTVNNMINGGTGTYKRASMKEMKATVKSGMKSIKNML